MDRLDDFIEFAEATRKFQDLGFYTKLKAYIIGLENRLAGLLKPRAIYSHHVGGNYGSPMYECSECRATGLVSEYSGKEPINEIKHKEGCSLARWKDSTNSSQISRKLVDVPTQKELIDTAFDLRYTGRPYAAEVVDRCALAFGYIPPEKEEE